MTMNLGINVLEVDGATPSLQSAPTSIAGFVVRTQRGVPGVVQEVSSFAQFADLFGAYVSAGASNGTQASYVGAYAIRGFFDNGGSLAYVLRVADAGKVAAASAAFLAATPASGGAAAGSGGPGGGGAASAPAAGGATSAPALTLTTAYRGAADPGLWGNAIYVRIVANTSNPKVTDAFDLVIARGTPANGTTTFQVLETWTRLSMSGAPGFLTPAALNDPATGSRYVMATTSGTAPPAPTPAPAPGYAGYVPLYGPPGTSGTAAPYSVDANVPTGAPKYTYSVVSIPAEDTLKDAATSGSNLNNALAAPFSTPSPFDTLPIQLFACPETADIGVVQAALTYCADRGDCMFVGHVPDGGAQPLAAAKTYGQGLQADKVYGALYMPYIQVVDPVGSLIWIPPTGHVLGVYARTSQQRGIWKAPAGNGALVSNALNVRANLNDTDHTDLVRNGSVNAIRSIAGTGIVVDSSRTLSTNTLWLYVNVRLLFNFVKATLRTGLRWVVQEPNDTTLWNKIKYNSVTPFLMGLWRAGAFGPGAAADVFRVKVDATNNPSSNIQQGLLNVEVYFYPSRPAETIVITVGQQQGASSATEG